MKRLLPLLCLFLLGCPYGSSVPLGEAEDSKIEQGLLGLWTLSSAEQGYSEVDIRAFNDHEYFIEMRDHEPHKPVDTHRYRAYSSKVGARMFLNMSELGSKDAERRWMFAAYESKDADTLAIRMLSDEPIKKLKEPPTTSKALHRFIEEHAQDPSLLETELILRRHAP